MSNSPNESQLRKVLLDRKAFAIQLNRQDAGIFIDVQIDGYHTGLKFMPPHGWTFWHNLKIIKSEIGAHFTGGLEHRMHATNCSISAKHCGVLMQMDEERWEPEWQKHLHSNRKGKEYGTKRDNGHLRMFNCSFEGSGTGIYLDGSFDQKINLQECTFKNWGTGPDDYAIKAIGGEIEVYDSHFKQGSRHIELQGRPKLLELVGNRFSGTPAIKAPNVKGSIIDHTPARDTGRSMRPIHAVPDMLPARTGGDSLFVVTAPPYNTPTDGKGDATTGIQAALKKAYKAGGGTVYLPQGRYRLTKPLKVPPGVELRGVNDFMPRSIQLRTLIIADIPADCGNPNNPPLISLYSSKKIGGSGIAGVSFWYPNQNYKDIQAYPWTIQGRGPGCWVQRVYLGNCYNAVDFATHDSDRHVLSRVCGSALNTAFFVGRSSTIGWIDNCHIRPQDWSLIMDERGKVTKNNRKGNNKTKRRKGYVFEIPGGPDSKPTKKDIFRGTPYSLIPNMRGAGAVVVGSGANEQITAFFTNGATRAFDFVDHTGRGGGNANILIGGSEAGWGAWIKKLGKKGITMVNFSFSAMTRFPYITPKDIPAGQLPKGLVIKIEPTVATTAPITMISPKFYGRGDIPLGVDMQGGDLSLKQGMTVIGFTKAVVDVKKGRFRQRNTKMGDVIGGSK